MSGLESACKTEGKLNVIALPPDWANYGEIIDAFKAKYGVTVESAQPDANRQDEINAAKQLAGTDRAPDVFDLGQGVALANTGMYAPYKVTAFDQIPAPFKDASGVWVNDYGGYMSVGYDAKKVPAVASLADLLKPEYKGKIALNGDPTQASAGYNGVLMRRSPTAVPPTTSRRGWTTSRSSRPRATSCRSTPPRRRSSPGRPPSSSTGITCILATPSTTSRTPCSGSRRRERTSTAWDGTTSRPSRIVANASGASWPPTARHHHSTWSTPSSGVVRQRSTSYCPWPHKASSPNAAGLPTA